MAIHRVAVLALDGVAPLDLAIPTQIFNSLPDTSYATTVCAVNAKVVTTGGFTLDAKGDLEHLRAADTVIVPGYELTRHPPQAVLATLAEARNRGRRVVSTYTGAFALAAAGVLDGLHATTYWQHLDNLEHDYPAVTVDRNVLYVDQGNVLTSAGVACGIDLCLHIVRRDLGAQAANTIARGLLAAPHRAGRQPQCVQTPVPETGHTSLATTRAWALQRLHQPLTLRILARHAGLSQRTYMRRFTEETGTTPLQWLLNARVHRAQELLETTHHSIDRIAQESGLGTAANLRLHFRRELHTTPTRYRRTYAH